MIKFKLLLCLPLLSLVSCNNKPKEDSSANHMQLANTFVDTFYSFDSNSLEEMLSAAEKSKPGILYYQKWAECGNYEVLKRDGYFEKNDSTVIFPVTVKDDLMDALQIDFNVTDTFRLTFRNDQIQEVQTSSNDPNEYYEAKEWVQTYRPEYVEKACEGIWEDGPTPCECIQGFVKGFHDFVHQEKLK